MRSPSGDCLSSLSAPWCTRLEPARPQLCSALSRNFTTTGTEAVVWTRSSTMRYTDIPSLGVGLAADVSGVLPNYRNFLAPNRDVIDYLSFGAHYLQLNRIKHYISDLIDDGFPIVFHPINFN